MPVINGVVYLTAEEALAKRLINKAQYERWIYGGLTQKQHDRMTTNALKVRVKR